MILTLSILGRWCSIERTIFNSLYFGRVWWSSKKSVLTVSTLVRCSGLERTEFLQFLHWECVLVFKELILNSFCFGQEG